MKEDVSMKKTILCITMLSLLLICFGCISAYAASESDLTYVVFNEEAKITDCKTSVSGELIIPETLGGYPVTSIGYDAFKSCNNLARITIPDSVTNIGSHAFDDCSGLISIKMPNSLTNIGAGAFVGCSSLANITIPNGVTSIGYATFWSCSSLVNITIPDGVTSIGKSAFQSCSSLISVTIPSSVANIEEDAFYGCYSLTNITIPCSVTSIGDFAFYNCNSLKNVNITDLEAWCNIDFSNSSSNPLYYASELYLNGNLLTNITIPDSVKSIGNYAFWGCSSLVSITIPDSVTSVEYYSFENCESLTDVYYYGTEDEWEFISIGRNNEPFTRATIHYIKHTRTIISVDGKEFTITPINIETGKNVILALYDGRKFVEMQSAVYTGETIPFTTTKIYTKAKVMVWDNLANLKPLCDVEIIK